MHLGCIEHDFTLFFQCKTPDMDSFSCECSYFDTRQGEVVTDVTQPDKSSFEKWMDDDACVAKKVKGRWKDDSPNLHQLFRYCDGRPHPRNLTCRVYKKFDPGNSFCSCENRNEDRKSPLFKFDDRLVWSDAKTTQEIEESNEIPFAKRVSVSSSDLGNTADDHYSFSKFQSDISPFLLPSILLITLLVCIFLIRRLCQSIKRHFKKKSSYPKKL